MRLFRGNEGEKQHRINAGRESVKNREKLSENKRMKETAPSKNIKIAVDREIHSMRGIIKSL